MEKFKSLEKLAQPVSSYRFVIIKPGGNDTCLINGIVENMAERKRINDLILGIYPNVEQVGFIELNPSPRLQMAGGEFCGNATRSTAWLALKGQPGEIEMSVFGVNDKLKAGVTKDGEAFAQMPIYNDPRKITSDPKGSIVEMEGITQFVNFDIDEIKGLTPEEIKEKGMSLIREKRLNSYPAAGVIWSEKNKDGWQITPVVYVKAMDTKYLETACGSGTTALGMVLALNKGDSIDRVPILQPSGMPIKISVKFDGKKFTYAEIEGPIGSLAAGKIESAKSFDYVIEEINEKKIDDVLSSNNLINLYQEIFIKPPYFEKFSSEQVADFFREYVKYGKLLLARTKGKVIGFAAIVPFSTQTELVQLAQKVGININDRDWYFSDLGVEEEYRKQGVATNLVNELQEEYGANSNIILRTQVNNVAALALYKKLGFSLIEAMQQEVEGIRDDETIRKDLRVFLMKSASTI